MSTTELSAMLGATIFSISGAKGDEEMVFTATDGRRFRFYHSQDCCEGVAIEDVCGDLADLTDSPITLAEESTSEGDVPGMDPSASLGYQPDSWTWTFYRFGTARGAVTVRWLGTSNGYYSERVDMEEVQP